METEISTCWFPPQIATKALAKSFPNQEAPPGLPCGYRGPSTLLILLHAFPGHKRQAGEEVDPVPTWEAELLAKAFHPRPLRLSGSILVRHAHLPEMHWSLQRARSMLSTSGRGEVGRELSFRQEPLERALPNTEGSHSPPPAPDGSRRIPTDPTRSGSQVLCSVFLALIYRQLWPNRVGRLGEGGGI